MFTTIIVQPIFNLLVLIYALIPGHNFGLAIIIFTIIVRLLMWPLVKKQINQAKAMRELQPELKKIKAAAAGDKRKEQQLTMELYKEREINPLASLGILLVQTPILIGLYIGLRKVFNNPHEIISFSYPALHHLPWMKTLGQNIHRFDNTLFGVVDLTRSALSQHGTYWPAMLIAVGSAIGQFFQGKQLMPKSQDSRGLRQILSEAGQGKTADQAEVNAAVGRGTLYIIPFFVLLVSLRFPAGLPLYWLTSSIVAIVQQGKILREDTEEAEAAVVTPAQPADKPKKPRRKKPGAKNRRRRK